MYSEISIPRASEDQAKSRYPPGLSASGLSEGSRYSPNGLSFYRGGCLLSSDSGSISNKKGGSSTVMETCPRGSISRGWTLILSRVRIHHQQFLFPSRHRALLGDPESPLGHLERRAPFSLAFSSAFWSKDEKRGGIWISNLGGEELKIMKSSKLYLSSYVHRLLTMIEGDGDRKQVLGNGYSLQGPRKY